MVRTKDITPQLSFPGSSVINKGAGPILFALLIIMLVLITPSLCSGGSWQTYTSFKDIRHMRIINDSLYLATAGGLLIVDDFNYPGRSYLNTDGLGTINITDVLSDSSSQIWLTGFGRLIQFDAADPKPFLFLPAEGDLFLLTRVIDDRDYLWVGTDSGLVLFSKYNDGGQIEGHFQLTTVNPFPKINDIILTDDSIWLATSSGLLVADKQSFDLPPAAWAIFGVDDYPELRSDTVRRVVSFESDIYVATSHGLFRLDRSGSDTSFTTIPIAQNRVVNDLVIERDSLFVYYDNGLGVLTSTGTAILPRDGLPPVPVTGIGWDGVRWVSVSGGGLYASISGVYEEYPYMGAPNNDVTTVTIDGDGFPVAGFGKTIYARFDGERWLDTGIRPRAGTTGLITDRFGNVWAGSWGQGLWLETGDTAVRYDETNSTCIGIVSDPHYVVIRGLAVSDDFIFAGCYLAATNFAVAVGRLDQPDDRLAWDSIGVTQGITNFLVTSLGYGAGQLAVGTEAAGLFLCDVDDALHGVETACVQYTKENSPLISNTIRVLKYSPRGNVWVGTNFGLSRWDAGIERFVDVNLPAGIGADISDLEFDGRGNLWIGSRTGLARIDGTSGAFTVYNTVNSDIVSDEITDLTLNPITDDLYVATKAGLSVLTPELRSRTSVLDSVVAVPNPFVIRSDADRLEFNFSQSGIARLYTIAGESVAEFSMNRSWGGRNQAGREVASGVYIYVLTDRDGNTATGKLLLVRKK